MSIPEYQLRVFDYLWDQEAVQSYATDLLADHFPGSKWRLSSQGGEGDYACRSDIGFLGWLVAEGAAPAYPDPMVTSVAERLSQALSRIRRHESRKLYELQVQAEQRQEAARLEMMVERTQVALLLVDQEERVVETNATFRQQFGDLVGSTLPETLGFLPPDDGEVHRLSLRTRVGLQPVDVRGLPRSTDDPLRVIQVQDCSELVSLQNRTEAAEEAAQRDPLTGLLNRRGWMQQCASRLPIDQPSVVALFDMDYFKAINDTWGHGVGDAVLIAMGRHLQCNLDNRDVIGRYGGEEFMVLMPAISMGIAERRLNEVRQALVDNPVEPSELGHALHVTASVGFSLLPKGGTSGSLDAVLEEADSALYGAKESGRNRVVGYSD